MRISNGLEMFAFLVRLEAIHVAICNDIGIDPYSSSIGVIPAYETHNLYAVMANMMLTAMWDDSTWSFSPLAND